MTRLIRRARLAAIGASGLLWAFGTGSCLADNFWIDKSSEIVNRLIFGAINAALGQAGPI